MRLTIRCSEQAPRSRHLRQTTATFHPPAGAAPAPPVAELDPLTVAGGGQSLKFLKFVATPKSRLRTN
jgi:hypothetical protein